MNNRHPYVSFPFSHSVHISLFRSPTVSAAHLGKKRTPLCVVVALFCLLAFFCLTLVIFFLLLRVRSRTARSDTLSEAFRSMGSLAYSCSCTVGACFAFLSSCACAGEAFCAGSGDRATPLREGVDEQKHVLPAVLGEGVAPPLPRWGGKGWKQCCRRTSGLVFGYLAFAAETAEG